MISQILTERLYQSWPSWDCVYEWEDVFCSSLNLSLEKIPAPSNVRKTLNKFLYDFQQFRSSKITSLGFLMNSTNTGRFKKYKIVPIFMDVFPGDIKKVVKECKSLPLFFVTCYDVYLQITALIGPNKCYYLPLMVSDKWLEKREPAKTIDVIQLGRKNPVLHSFMLEYCEKNPHVNYVFQTSKNAGDLTYYSTTQGDLGVFIGRDKFMNLLFSSKVSLVSSPGAEGDSRFGRGIDFFTPRFYESAIAGCYLVGRYTENEECHRLEIPKVCLNVRDYIHFSDSIDDYLHSSVFEKKTENELFVNENLASHRAEQMRIVLLKCGLL